MIHEAEIRHHAPRKYSVRCSCGWEGDTWPSEGAAYRDHDEHVVAIVRAEA